MIGRRALLRGAAAGGIAGVCGLATQPGTVLADHGDAQPDHVTLSYDQQRLERYRPLVEIPHDAPVRPTAWKAWTAESPEYDYTAHAYVLHYESQVTGRSADSHRRDREPVYVFVDEDLGEVREVVYSAYHWLSYRERSPPTWIPEEDDGEHVTLRSVPPWNHYVQTETIGEKFDVDPLGTTDGEPFHPDPDRKTTFETWLDTGWEAALHPGAAQDPDSMRWRDAWWRDGEERWARTLWSIQLRLAALGLTRPSVVGGAAESDLS